MLEMRSRKIESEKEVCYHFVYHLIVNKNNDNNK